MPRGRMHSYAHGLQVFDETDGHWTTHLDGAKYMLEGLYPEYRRQLRADFLFTWFLYHEVLACFSQPLRQAHNCIDVLFLLGASNCDATVVSLRNCIPLSLPTWYMA